MENINFNTLTPQQIEVRPTNTKNKGNANLLLYIDSRCAANILNDAVGQFNWQIDYKDVAGKIYGTLSIWDNDKQQWVCKTDTGSESNIEADKGQASDILKRCIARWGCDYLYSSPEIRIKCPDSYYYNDKMTMTFSVKEIDYIGKKISRLVIVDRFNNVVFDWSANNALTPTNKTNITPNTVEKNNTTENAPTNTNTNTVEKYKQELKEFVVNNHTEKNETQIKKFYTYYLNILNEKGWTGKMDINKLFNNWMSKAFN